METIYLVKRFKNFPKRKANDTVMKRLKSLKQAQLLSISLNEKFNSRFYVEKIDMYPKESATS
jgi:hypothetical protein